MTITITSNWIDVPRHVSISHKFVYSISVKRFIILVRKLTQPDVEISIVAFATTFFSIAHFGLRF